MSQAKAFTLFPHTPRCPATLFFLLLLTFLFEPTRVLATAMVNDPNGFQGIPWGTSLGTQPHLILVDHGDLIQTYTPQDSPHKLGNIKVESIKLLTVHDQFARVLIRYQGEQTHKQIMIFLESTFGKVGVNRGAMIRGLNQQYTWRGTKTEINLTYRGLGERGFLDVESRVLAPRFLDVLSDHSH